MIVIGHHLYAVAIRAGGATAHVDWRADYDSLSYDDVDPPIDVQRGVHAVMDELGLANGAFDFVITPEGRWVFLEVNPGGQFGWLEDKTGVPLTVTLADLLAREAS